MVLGTAFPAVASDNSNRKCLEDISQASGPRKYSFLLNPWETINRCSNPPREGHYRERQHRSRSSWRAARVCAIAGETGDTMVLPRSGSVTCPQRVYQPRRSFSRTRMLTDLCNEDVSLVRKPGHTTATWVAVGVGQDKPPPSHALLGPYLPP